MKHTLKMFAAAGVIAASASVLQAQPYFVVGDVINGWADPGAIQMDGGPAVYTYAVTGGTTDNYEQLKVTVGNWGTAWPQGGNVKPRLDATGGNTIYFYPGTATDGWNPAQNRVGYADPGNMSFELTGEFTGPNWGSDPLAQMVPAGNGVYTNTYTITNAGTYGFKFRTPGTWNDVNFGSDFGNGGGNASVTTTNANQKVLFQLDLPNGRWLAGNFAPPPVTNTVVFAVDMTVQTQVGNFDPAVDTVFVSGQFNGWPGIKAGALVLTNYPPYNGNTNIYYGTNIFVGAPGSLGSEYKFTCNDPAFSGATGYEPISANRQATLLKVNGTILQSVVKFGDLSLSDYSSADVQVTFTVNMTNATSYWDGHVFDPQNDSVFINGSFISGGWSAWNPLALTPMQNDPVGSQIYTYTTTIPVKSMIKIDYKYSMNYAGSTNWDNEAAAYSDHFRYIRATGTGAYVNALDKFGNQYVEPSFGQLASAKSGPGSVSVSWVGRPGVELQVSTNLSAWQTLMETDGTNWTTGYNSTNGMVSQTNTPAIGKQFFRLIQAW